MSGDVGMSSRVGFGVVRRTLDARVEEPYFANCESAKTQLIIRTNPEFTRLSCNEGLDGE